MQKQWFYDLLVGFVEVAMPSAHRASNIQSDSLNLESKKVSNAVQQHFQMQRWWDQRLAQDQCKLR